MCNTDRLLNLMTARGEIRFARLKDVLSQLEANSDSMLSSSGLRPYLVGRALDMLGHCEYEKGAAGGLAIASPCLGKLPILGKERYFLTGARTAKTLTEIQSAAKDGGIRIIVQKSLQDRADATLLPHRILIDFCSAGDAVKLGHLLNISVNTTPPAWVLACFSQGLKDFEQSLEWHPRNASLGAIETFDTSVLSFRNLSSPGDSFLCEPASASGSVYAVVEDREARVTDLDWGRYWALARSDFSVILHDLQRRCVAVPASLPLPRLLARSLCLCSAEIPKPFRIRQTSGTREYNVFTVVPPEIAGQVSQRLGMDFVPQPIQPV
jgi:hypothetical protein